MLGLGLDETRDFYYSEDWQVLEERVEGAETAERQYVWGTTYIDDLILRDGDADANSGNGLEERLYATHDALYSVTALVNASGTVQERFAYTPYGQDLVLDANFAIDADSLSDFDWTVRYAGQTRDADAGFYTYRSRYFHPWIGTFLTRDPLGYAEGANLFCYVHNAPTVWTDPLGFRSVGAEFLECRRECEDECYDTYQNSSFWSMDGSGIRLLFCTRACGIECSRENSDTGEPKEIPLPPIPSCPCFSSGNELHDILICMRDAAEAHRRAGGENACFAYRDCQGMSQCTKSEKYEVISGTVLNWWGPFAHDLDPKVRESDAGYFICDKAHGGCLYVHFLPLSGIDPWFMIECYDPDSYYFGQHPVPGYFPGTQDPPYSYIDYFDDVGPGIWLGP